MSIELAVSITSQETDNNSTTAMECNAIFFFLFTVFEKDQTNNVLIALNAKEGG